MDPSNVCDRGIELVGHMTLVSDSHSVCLFSEFSEMRQEEN